MQRVGKGNKRRKNKRRSKFGKINEFLKNLIGGTNYNFYKRKTDPTVDSTHETLKDISNGTSYKNPYGRPTFASFAKKTWF